MKVSFLIMFMLLLAGTSYAQYTYILNIRSQELEGKKIKLYLLDNAGHQALKIDSSVCTNGMIRFKGALSQPVHFVELGFKNKGKSASLKFPLDSGEHSVRLEMGKGSNEQPSLSGLETSSMKIRTESEQLWHALYDKYPLGPHGRTIPKEIFLEDLKNQLQLVSNHPKDFFSVLLLYRISAGEVSLSHANAVLEAWAKLDTKLGESPLGLSIYKRQKNFIKGYLAAQVGKDIINFTVSDIDGNTFDSQSLSGQKYLIVLSATWCLPCQKQLPLLKALYDKYKASGLKVVYFNNDDDVVKWKEHIKKNELTWINVSERLKFSNSKIPKSFGIYAVPTCILVDAKGKITYNSDQEDTGLDKLEAAIKHTI
ncbi:TlpA family protein disulfide reductase [Pedobacter kyonggii]|uniref:TlpA family protein disulfide reductase n=1 Tax=Pedobacter kyonggii TaxID=1926871 RepID=A0A4Q9H6D2_9SPHI|nr:TlpA disulfide reductase family protein [Pedobacter kyonggii]TBO36444.1 TlpA family protein disulfide reductase [Pedobacter kyonggii]